MRPPADSNSVENVPLLPTILYNNAGFNGLRSLKELDGVAPRFDPTVIPQRQPGEETVATLPETTDLRVPPQNAGGRFYTVLDYHNAYKSGLITPSDVVEALLPLIRRDISERTPHSTAFIDSKIALVKEAAAASTKRWKEGKSLGLLDGVPFGAKDDLDVKGYKRYIGGKKDHTEGKEVETSWCVAKLEEAGSIMMGKMTMHEVGMGKLTLVVTRDGFGTCIRPDTIQIRRIITRIGARLSTPTTQITTAVVRLEAAVTLLLQVSSPLPLDQMVEAPSAFPATIAVSTGLSPPTAECLPCRSFLRTCQSL